VLLGFDAGSFYDLPIELPGTARPLALITLKNRTLNPLAELFADSTRDVAKRLRKM